jgi:hypothetical protein
MYVGITGGVLERMTESTPVVKTPKKSKAK